MAVVTAHRRRPRKNIGAEIEKRPQANEAAADRASIKSRNLAMGALNYDDLRMRGGDVMLNHV